MTEHQSRPQPPATAAGQTGGRLSRRQALQLGAIGLGASTLSIVDALTAAPERLVHAAPAGLPDIQFDIASYLGPVRTINNVAFRFPPLYTLFVTARLTRTPSQADQQVFAAALNTIEATYPFSPQGVFTCVAYGIPYFARLPGGMAGQLVATTMPRLLADQTQYALQEAVPGPTDVIQGDPSTATKQTYNMPVTIEGNDVLITLRSDVLANLTAVVAWLQGSNTLNGQAVPSPALQGLFAITSTRLMFIGAGAPRKIATAQQLPYAARMNPLSPMWMGFADQQTDGSGPAAIATFQGTASAQLTTATAQSYFADGAIQHLSHVVLDLDQFYADPAEPYVQRVQYMFRANPVPSQGYADQFANGGGPAYLDNTYQGATDALHNAQGLNTYQGGRRVCHLASLQRSSRAADGTPIHVRADGPGFDAMDMPDGSHHPKLQFTIFVPAAQFFTRLRINQASLDYVHTYQVAPNNAGLERFLTATRRQNFLCPPRVHRSFPLLDYT